MTDKHIIAVVCVLLLSACTGADSAKYNKDGPGRGDKIAPEIIDVFACSDYCPGPAEQYVVKAYKDINNSIDCAKVGGIAYEYIGWGRHFVCKVK